MTETNELREETATLPPIGSEDPDALCDAFFLSKSTTLQLFRVDPITYKKIVGTEVHTFSRSRDPFQFEDGRYPPTGDRITNRVANELRNHPLFNQRFIEYTPKPVPAHVETSRLLTAENQALREQLAKMQARESELAQKLEAAYQVKGEKKTHMSPPAEVQRPAPSPAPAPKPVPAAPPVMGEDEVVAEEGDQGPVFDESPQGAMIESITNKGDALEALKALDLPIETLGNNPTKQAIIDFAGQHGVSFPGY